MGRDRRDILPGSFYHVWNRGIARRNIYECARDFDHYEALLGRARHRDILETHAFALMPNHPHLLVRAGPDGISEGLRWISHQHAMRFNKCVGRDGSLYRGRFKHRAVAPGRDLAILVHYIDRNPVKAALAATSTDYPFGSARHYARQSGPSWLCRTAVEELVMGATGVRPYDPVCYSEVFPARAELEHDGFWWVDRMMHLCPGRTARLLIDDVPEAMRAFMLERAERADGKVLMPPALPLPTVERAIARAATMDPHWALLKSRSRHPGWLTLRAGLLRLLVGLSITEISIHLRVSRSTVSRRIFDHIRSDRDEPQYRERVLQVLAAMRHAYSPTHRAPLPGESVPGTK